MSKQKSPSPRLSLDELIAAENFSLDLHYDDACRLADELQCLMRDDLCLAMQFVALKRKMIFYKEFGFVISYGWVADGRDGSTAHGLCCGLGDIIVPTDKLCECKTPEEMLSLFETEYAIQKLTS